MFEYLTCERLNELASSNQKIAVYKEYPGDSLTLTRAYRALREIYNDVTLLDYEQTHLCFGHLVQIESYGQDVKVIEQGEEKSFNQDPFEVLRQYQKKYRAETSHPLSGYVGGLVGFVSYDAIRLIENIPNNNFCEDDIPDLFFRSYENNICFDRATNKIVFSKVISGEENLEAAYQKMDDLIEFMLCHPIRSRKKSASSVSEVEENLSDEQYKKIVERAKKYIVEGDIFQVVPSRKFSAKIKCDAFDVYRALKYCSKSPYMFFLETDRFAIAGASPEKLVTVKDKLIESRPLAGTRPRKKPEDDEGIANELVSDEKEMAEHMMLVDLARNDVGSISVPGSVDVVKLADVEKFTRVIHISSTVQGVLRNGYDAFDALKASFPAGTLSGAPKIRAMEIIDELESSRRGIYGGAICAIDAEGNLDSCIAIRTAVVKDGVASVQAGGGVVFDSDPQKEADETRHKARSILEGIKLAEEMVL